MERPSISTLNAIQVIIAFVLVLPSTGPAGYGDPQEVLSFTEGRTTRVVWVRMKRPAYPVPPGAPRLLLAWDSETGEERSLVRSESPRFEYPQITPDGRQVVYNDGKEIHAVDWETGETTLLKENGLGPVGIWRDTLGGRTWVYYRSFRDGTDTVAAIKRFSLSSPEDGEQLVWEKILPGQTSVLVGRISFSRDGRYMAGEFPWPLMGIADLSNKQFYEICRPCCNAAISPDNSYITMNMTTGHQTVHLTEGIVQGDRRELAVLNISEAIAAKTGEPVQRESTCRWTNDTRFLLGVGPDYDGEKQHLRSVRLFRLSPELNRIEDVVLITEPSGITGREEFAHAWIESPGVLDMGRSTLKLSVNHDDRRIVRDTVKVTLPEGLEDSIPSVAQDVEWLETRYQGEGETGSIIIGADPAGLESGIHTARITLSIGRIVEYLMVYFKIVGEPVVSELTLSPPSVTLGPLESQNFTPGIYDQYGELIESSVHWEVSGGGAIDTNGVFTSDGTEGVFLLTAKAGGLETTVSISVVSGVPIDTGAIAQMLCLLHRGSMYLPVEDTSDVSSWYHKRGNHPVSPGERVPVGKKEYVWTSLQKTDGIWAHDTGKGNEFVSYFALPAIFPDSVAYTTAVTQSHRLSVFVNGKHFQTVHKGGSGKEQLLRSGIAGKEAREFIFRLHHRNKDGRPGHFRIRFTDLHGQSLSGLRLKSLTEPDSTIVHVSSPIPGSTYSFEDTILISWSGVVPRIDGVLLEFSSDFGATWTRLNTNTILPQDTLWGNYQWVPSESLPERVSSGTCLIKARCYNLPYADQTDSFFGLGAPAKTENAHHEAGSSVPFKLRKTPETFVLSGLRHRSRIRLFTLQGRLIWASTVNREENVFIAENTGLCSGVFVLEISHGHQKYVTRVSP